MTDFFSEMQFWHWFAFGGVLLLIEMLVPATIFLWPGIAAVTIGILMFVIPDMPWTMSVPLWAILSVATAFGWRAYRKKNPASVDAAAATLNQRGSEYIGRQFTLESPIANGVGKMKVGDTVWNVVSETDFIAGATVKVTGVDGTSLRVGPAS